MDYHYEGKFDLKWYILKNTTCKFWIIRKQDWGLQCQTQLNVHCSNGNMSHTSSVYAASDQPEFEAKFWVSPRDYVWFGWVVGPFQC